MPSRFAAVVAMAAALTLSSAPARAERPTLALVVGDTVNVSLDEAYAWADGIGAAIGERGDAIVVPSAVVRQNTPARGLNPACFANRHCLNALAAKVAATELLILHFVRIAGQVQIDTTWLDLTGKHGAVRGAISFVDTPQDARVAFQLGVRTVRPPVVVEPESSSSPSDERLNVGAWLSGGAAAGLLVGAVALTFAAVGADDDVADCADEIEAGGSMTSSCLGNKDLFDLRDKRDNRALAADVLWLGTGVAATTAILFAVFHSDSGPPVSATVGGNGASLSWTRRF